MIHVRTRKEVFYQYEIMPSYIFPSFFIIQIKYCIVFSFVHVMLHTQKGERQIVTVPIQRRYAREGGRQRYNCEGTACS